MDEKPDYVFRYPLEESGMGGPDPLLEMIRIQTESLLNLFSLYHQGEEVKVDGFRLMNEREIIHPLFRQDRGKPEAPPESADSTPQEGRKFSLQSARNAGLYEPRIPHIKRVLESLFSVVVLESRGKPVEIDGFRLKDLNHWLVPSVGDPAEVFDHLATRCDCSCSFCYLRGNPPSLALERPGKPAEEEFQEAKTRLKYFFPRRKRALFPTMGSPHEILSHPYALDLLGELRRKTDRPLRLSTNGNNLTLDFVERLSSLKPIYLYLSLNSCRPARRARIMGGKNPETAIRSLPLLKEREIPYAVVIVPWPFPSQEEMVADLKETVACADRHDAHLVEVSLPGYTRYFSKSSLFDLEEVWSSAVLAVRSLRGEVNIPLLVKPSLFEETKYEKVLNRPGIGGLVKNSPAAVSGLKAGDIIVSVGGLKASSRPQARDLLHLHHRRRSPSIAVSVLRAGEIIEATLLPDRFGYPYTPETDHHLGIIFLGAGFRPSILEDLKSLIVARRAKKVLLFSSRLVKPVLQQLLRESSLLGDIRVEVQVPQNGYFGGNIFMGDLLVVQDFIEAIQDYLETNPPPDLIVIPASPFSLGQWGRDLEGRVYTEIERAVGLPVAVLDCEPIYD
jgi:hypothetical protein